MVLDLGRIQFGGIGVLLSGELDKPFPERSGNWLPLPRFGRLT